MNEFNLLRARAKEKRDNIVAAANREYETALSQIASLARLILGDLPLHRRLSASIESVVPSDRPFTTRDLLELLQAAEPTRLWRQASIDNHLQRLIKRGIVKRVQKRLNRRGAVYARSDLPAAIGENRTLREFIAATVVRPMTMTEIAVTVREAGYRSTMSAASLRTEIERALKRDGFRRAGDRWSRA